MSADSTTPQTPGESAPTDSSTPPAIGPSAATQQDADLLQRLDRHARTTAVPVSSGLACGLFAESAARIRTLLGSIEHMTLSAPLATRSEGADTADAPLQGETVVPGVWSIRERLGLALQSHENGARDLDDALRAYSIDSNDLRILLAAARSLDTATETSHGE